MPYMTIDSDIDVDNFWDECSQSEREALKELVVEEFGLSTNPEDTITALLRLFGEGADSTEARSFVRKVVEEVEYRLKTHDFSELIVK